MINKYNHEHYNDPTAYSAVTNITTEEQAVNKLLKTLKYIISLSDFTLNDRIQLKHRSSGRVYK